MFINDSKVQQAIAIDNYFDIIILKMNIDMYRWVNFYQIFRIIRYCFLRALIV